MNVWVKMATPSSTISAELLVAPRLRKRSGFGARFYPFTFILNKQTSTQTFYCVGAFAVFRQIVLVTSE